MQTPGVAIEPLPSPKHGTETVGERGGCMYGCSQALWHAHAGPNNKQPTSAHSQGVSRTQLSHACTYTQTSLISVPVTHAHSCHQHTRIPAPRNPSPTHSHTHTLLQQGLLYYNRRIPKALGGGLIRIKLPDNSISETLSKRIEAAWVMGYSPDPALILANIMEETKPLSLDKIAEDYIRIRQISPKPVLISIKMLMNVAGQKPLVDYNRADVRSFLIKSKEVGHKTTTIRRRLNSLSAVFNFGYHEYEIDRRNPFTKVWIEGEGEDSFSRVPFKLPELKSIYRHSVQYGGVRSMFPISPVWGLSLGSYVITYTSSANSQEGKGGGSGVEWVSSVLGTGIGRCRMGRCCTYFMDLLSFLTLAPPGINWGNWEH